jgi:hypothetical protein
MDSGKWIREVREASFVKSSDIERISRSIADGRGNADFYVSHSTLADIETGSVPSIHKLFSLATCLKLSLDELLLAFGIDLNEVQHAGPPETRAPRREIAEALEPDFQFQLNFGAWHFPAMIETDPLLGRRCRGHRQHDSYGIAGLVGLRVPQASE